MWDLLTRNFGWKLGSLAMAVMLWIALDGAPELVTTHEVPILYRNLAPDLLIGPSAADQVRVELRGPSGRLTAASLSELAAMLDLSGIRGPEQRTFTFSEADFRLPPGVAFVRAIPSQLQLRFARRKTRDVPVEVTFSAPPPAGYVVVRQEATPSTIQIAGPEGRVEAIAAAQTDPIDLSSVTQNRSFRANTFVADPQVWLESSPLVTVTVVIEKRGKTN